MKKYPVFIILILLFTSLAFASPVKHYEVLLESTEVSTRGFITLDVSDQIVISIGMTVDSWFFCGTPEVIVQEGVQYEIGPYSWDDIPISWVNFDGCGTIYEGITAVGTIDTFPEEFDITDDFRIYLGVFSDRDYIDVSDNNFPEQPGSPNPPDDAENVLTDTTLSWSCSDPNGDDLTYDLYYAIDTPDSFNNKVSLTSDNHTLTDLYPEATYYWKVVATDDNGGSTESPVWSFTTAAASLSPCPAERILRSDHETLHKRRAFRDNTLANSPSGRTLIRAYYNYAPTLNNLLTTAPDTQIPLAQLLKLIFSEK